MDSSTIEIAKRARAAALKLANVSNEKKNEALEKLAKLLVENESAIIAENKKDVEAATKAGISKAMIERLELNSKKIAGIAEGIKQVISLDDPVGKIIESVKRPNGIRIDKVSAPIGVIGIIYESRPNVTIDCAILCLKSGNASILRGGSEAFNSNMALAKLITRALKESGLDEHCVQIIPTADRAAFSELLKLDSYVDCIIPRGGENLIRFVVENSSIPVIKHYKGVCTIYVNKDADVKMAEDILINAKCQRPSVCNAAENLVVDACIAEEVLPKLCGALSAKGVEIRASEKALAILKSSGVDSKLANEEDFSTEYTDLIISVDVVDSVADAIAFINKYGSAHSDCIVTKNSAAAEEFLNGVDSATVYWNASTRFTDGFEFGLGAEIGISTDKLHARGPMGLKELCSYKYKIYGSGQIRG